MPSVRPGSLPRGRTPATRALARGVTLVELMIALVLGLIVVGAAMSVFLANKQTYLAAENLGRIQESGRVAFELMARDIRETGVDACGTDLADAANVLNAPTAHWYTDIGNGLKGYAGGMPFADAPFGTGEGQRIAGTDALELKSTAADGATIQTHVAVSARFQLNDSDHGLSVGDLAVACDPQHASLFQVTNASPGINANIVHQTGSGTPGNCSKGLGTPVVCLPATGTSYQFGCAYGGTDASLDCTDDANRWSAYIAKLQALRWYVGCNGRAPCSESTGRSLYRSRLAYVAGVPGVENDEIAEGVTGMSLTYLVDEADAYVSAAAVADWSAVVAVAVDLQLAGPERVDGQVVQGSLEHVVALRSRAP